MWSCCRQLVENTRESAPSEIISLVRHICEIVLQKQKLLPVLTYLNCAGGTEIWITLFFKAHWMCVLHLHIDFFYKIGAWIYSDHFKLFS